jgi:ABC-2 type transport system ATP-binding protein
VAILLDGRIVTVGSPRDLTASGSGLTKVSVRSEQGSVLADPPDLPCVAESRVSEDYAVLFTRDIGATVAAVLERLDQSDDPLIDLRVERPSLEERFLELTGGDR